MISSFAFVPTIGSLQRVVDGHSNKLLSALIRDRQVDLAGTCLTRFERIYGSSRETPPTPASKFLRGGEHCFAYSMVCD